MTNIRKEVEPNIIQITLDKERWYRVENEEHEINYYPSVTWILESYPKNIAFHKYLASLPNWEQGQKILADAGERGGKVHAGVETLLRGLTLSIHDIMPEYIEPFTAKEWQYIISFIAWWERYQPLILTVEETVISTEMNYAGTADLVCLIDVGMFEKEPKKTGKTEIYLIDWKTSANIYESYKCQVTAYYEARGSLNNVGIVRLGSKHKCGYEFWRAESVDEIQHYFDLFLNVKKIWEHENPNPEPKIIDVPETLSLMMEVTNEEEHSSENIDRQEGENPVGNEGQKQQGQGISKEPELF